MAFGRDSVFSAAVDHLMSPITRRDLLTTSAGMIGGLATAGPGRAEQDRSAVLGGDALAHQRAHGDARRPNILVIVLDDVGFADLGCYGSEISTPTIDRLASDGARLNNFHVTALCAPTRACLLTGMNAHAAGVGNIAEWGRPLPGYRGSIKPGIATIADHLRSLGYTTHALGKWHLTPLDAQSGAGTFDQWPTSRGFDQWYGFHSSAADHWYPELFENTSEARVVRSADYHLTKDLVDRAITYISGSIAARPDVPFFSYVALGACHFPLHAPRAFIERYRGTYDVGWDIIRQRRFIRQNELGIVPDGTSLAPSNPDVPRWNSLSVAERRVAARLQECYSGFLEHTDAQLGRLTSYLEQAGLLETTRIFVLSDNGAGPGGPPAGQLDVRRQGYAPEPVEEMLKHLDDIGTVDSFARYPPGWAQSSNTPLKWYKSDVHGGGTRAPLVIFGGSSEQTRGAILRQYAHAVDIVPTILDLVASGSGARSKLEGSSFAHALTRPHAATRKTMQVFETAGDRAIWAGGWKAIVKHSKGTSFDADTWELYRTDDDFSETRDLAAAFPERLRELKRLWDIEARRSGILPMADDNDGLFEAASPKPRARYIFHPGMTRLDRLSAPDLATYDARLAVSVVVGDMANGVLLASGDTAAGYELFFSDGQVVFHYVYARRQHAAIRTSRLAAGTHEVQLLVQSAGAAGRRLRLVVNGQEQAAMTLARMWPLYAPNAGLRCGANDGSPISRSYIGENRFTGKMSSLIVQLDLNSKTGAALSAT